LFMDNNKQHEKKEETKRAKTLSGTVVSTKMKDTIVVRVEQYKKVPKYGKYVMRSKRYLAHDLGNTKKIGDKVEIKECRPLSKNKHFKV